MRSFIAAAVLAAITLQPVALAAGPHRRDPVVVAREAYVRGETPLLKVEGLAPGETVTLHLFRKLTRWVSDGSGGWRPEPTLMHAWGRHRADAAGAIDLQTSVPEAGSSLAVGPRTLFWSGRRQGDPLLADQAFASEGVDLTSETTLMLRITRGHEVVVERIFGVDRVRAAMTRVDVVTPGLVGAFAAPAGGSALPTLIHLHGSEGGSLDKARDVAARYAEQGFAVLAVAYFAWPYEIGDLTVPTAHENIPVELLDRARLWLADRPEADVSRLGLVGNSKGAEFAMVGAVTYDWVKAAVGCVPSDVVWEGYGSAIFDGGAVKVPEPGTYSSWSWQGRPLAYIPTYGDRRDDFLDNTDRYDRARAEFASEARAARIPIERTSARLFLIGGDRDRTWSSGAMVRSLSNAMDAVGKGDLVETFISPTGGHFLCGEGLYPHRLWQVDDPSPFAPDIDAQGRAEATAYEAKIAFLKRVL
ncbi:acyl-CoA thioester hydrolase/BAAT C-terminal domain-containing protein [Brevundimonas sp.]|jgi:hypothetical protein|uniref:acyl-CoA thioester hydrolase/BAAT C-terminal domain-containing protein n=1 Tax=Brevundimonas sp. TaxID=1871086 RepID=UPI002E15A10D|nr:acyl-CoA thioester hydrolase/BAAT C-terminal domain-containing protein [Brevundimonas sp.]